MHFYANPSDVRIFLPRRATAFRKNAVECTDCAGNRRPEIADGEQRLLLHWHCIFRFRVPISWVPSSHPQFPSTSTIASTSTSRSRSRRAPKMCAKKTEKSARKIRVASLCLWLCVCVSVWVCPKFGASFLTECVCERRRWGRLGGSDALATHKEMGKVRTYTEPHRLVFTFLEIAKGITYTFNMAWEFRF